MKKMYYFHWLRKESLFLVMLLLFLFLSNNIAVYGQYRDNVYLVDETAIKNVEIVEVGEKKLKFRNQHGKDLAFNSKQILIAFNGQGKYLPFPHNPEQLRKFFAKDEAPTEIDLVITLSEQVIQGNINDENDFEITFHDIASNQLNQKISVNDIAAIIYKDGRHKFFTSPSQASTILATLSDEVFSSRQVLNRKVVEEKVFIPVVEPVSQKEELRHNSEEESGMPPTPAEKTKSPSSLEVDPELFREKALQKTRDLETYLAIISNRDTDLVEVNEAVELAIKLFVDEEKQVEVSGKSGKAYYKIRTYLNRLKLLKYDQVKISWTDVSYVSDLKKGPDGNYYGIISFQQRFESFLDGKVVYSDLTKKNVEVIVRPYQKETDGGKEELWEVLLMDIGIVETKFDQ